MDSPLNVFIPAAGLGERLRPLTDMIPKSLLPILGKPILEIVLDRVLRLPVDTVGINLFHKREMVEQWVQASEFSKRVVMFPEADLLGTGGALKNACSLLGMGDFLVHNADVISDIDLKALLALHYRSGNLATLVVHDRPGLNSIVVDEEGNVAGVGDWRMPGLGSFVMRAFTGIAFYSPEFLSFLPEGVSHIVEAWMSALSNGYKIGTADASGAYWCDIGSPSAYFHAVRHALRAEGEFIYVDVLSNDCADAFLDGYVAVEGNVRFGRSVVLKNCLIMPGSCLDAERRYEDCILGPNFTIDLPSTLHVGVYSDRSSLPLGTGGSDRVYVRTKKGNGTAILMKCREDDPDFQRLVHITRFFADQGIPVPELLEVIPKDRSALFEDLGDCSLYSWLKCRGNRDEVMRIYRRVIDIIIRVHTIPSERLFVCSDIKERVLGYEDLLGESAYFMERFVRGIMNRKEQEDPGLEHDFRALAERVSSFPLTVIHRDLQSQNIMVVAGKHPYLIDYQGARMGPSAYDLASLLWDPYQCLSETYRQELLQYYAKRMKSERTSFSIESFLRTVLPCRLQRHMQALGAYGFLAAVKKKRYFLKYVHEGLRLLKEDAALSSDDYPALHELVMKL